MTGSSQVIGIDIGGTKIAAAVVDEHGAIVGEVRSVATPVELGRAAVLDAIVSIARELLERAPAAAVGIGSAGVFDADGTVSSATDLLPQWTGTRLAAHVSSGLGLPVTAINDVHAAGIGEATHGAGAGHPHVLVVAVGTGVGGAVVHDGVVDTGRTGTGGSFGHVAVSQHPARRCSCGALGHVEPFASGPGMELSYRERTGRLLSLRQIAALDDPDARSVIAEGGAILGEALAGAANLLDPDLIVVGGGVAQIGESYLASIRESYRAHCLPGPASTPIVAARLGTTATLIGAAVRARGGVLPSS